ncbi:MAG: ArsR/SmtB family transcription factor [Cyanobium sp.]
MPSPQLLEEYSQFFRLLSEPARLQLLCLLKHRPKDVAALMEATGFSQSHISRQQPRAWSREGCSRGGQVVTMGLEGHGGSPQGAPSLGAPGGGVNYCRSREEGGQP